MNHKPAFLRVLASFFFVVISPLTMVAQQSDAVTPDPAPVAAVAASAPKPKLAPVLPVRDPNLVFVEAEDAIATNFAREPILNYDCSGMKTLQLNQTQGLKGGAAYYADFAFRIERTGTYELWYGGTPPGSKNELAPSFSSPFSFTVDAGGRTDVFRESVNVVSSYSPAYYWVRVGDVPLQAGDHRLKFEVSLRRNHDNKYFFYMDGFFFVRKEGKAIVPPTVVPAVFPKNLEDRKIDTPFRSIEEYEQRIKADPQNYLNYVELSTVYSLVGDYLNSLKYLRRAILLEPDHPDILLLTAKNTLWKGDSGEAVKLYGKFLDLYPDRKGVWTESGKLAGWTGQYSTAEKFYRDALKFFPDDMGLTVNLGLNQLWAGKVFEADILFEKAGKLAGKDVNALKALASVYDVNGYPGKACEVMEKAVGLAPEDAESYLLLENYYSRDGKDSEAARVASLAKERMEETPELVALYGAYRARRELRDKAFSDMESRLKVDPDNLELRGALAEMYFWNGKRKESILGYSDILVNHAYLAASSFEKDSANLFSVLDGAYAYLAWLDSVPARSKSLSSSLQAGVEAKSRADREYSAKTAENQALAAKGKATDSEKEALLAARAEDAAGLLAGQLNAIDAFLSKYDSQFAEFTVDRDAADRLKAGDADDAEKFATLKGGSPWRFDRPAVKAELEAARSRGNVLASYVLGRIALVDGAPASARQFFQEAGKSGSAVAGTGYGSFEAELFSSRLAEAASIAKGEMDGVSSKYVTDGLRSRLDAFVSPPDSVPGNWGAESEALVSKAKKDLDAVATRSMTDKPAVRAVIARLQGLSKDRLERAWHDLAQDTYLLRNVLGDFLQAEKRWGEAVGQFRQVLAIDPLDLNAMFKMGQVSRESGNWSEAKAYFQKVYDQDPQFRNVASYYNQLAWEHPDSFDVGVSTLIEPLRLSDEASASYRTEFTDWLGFGLEISESRSRKIGSASDDSYSVYGIAASLPFSFLGGKLGLEPSGALAILFDQDRGFDPVVSPGPLGTLSAFRTYPEGGLLSTLDIAGVKGSIGAGTAMIQDTFFPGLDPMREYSADASVLAYLNGFGLDLPGNPSFRAYGSGRLISDGNYSYGVGGEVSVLFAVLKFPVIEVGISLPGSWEDSALSVPAAAYWLPRKSLVAGATTSVQGTFGNVAEGAFIPSLRTGVTWQSAWSSAAEGGSISSLVFRGELRCEYAKEQWSAWVVSAFSGTNDIAPVSLILSYWNCSIQAGFSVKAPELLSK